LTRRHAAFLLLAVPALAGCRQDMHDAPRYEPYETSEFFGDGRSVRPQVQGTVARGQLREDALFFTGRTGATLAAAIPMTVDRTLLVRGRERFGIYCTPCHGQAGRGDGMVVRRGFRQPTSFHDDRLRAQPPGHFYDVITNGFGTMPDYAAQITPRDRWAIVAYIRALQLSQHADFAALPAALQERVRQGVAPEAGDASRPPADRGVPPSGPRPEASPQGEQH
jgi:mono/diheme cytochrome c family protein